MIGVNASAGKFITIEGTEGVGKTTNVAFVQSYLESRGIDLLVTREPGGTPLAEELREILLARRDEVVDPTAELLLVFAARAQHLNRVIKPALAAGKWVLCDRFTDATYAYQGCGRGLSLSIIAALETMVQQELRPDKTFILDIDVQLGLERAGKRGELDRFETEEVNFFERVRAGYQRRAQDNPERYCTVDAGQSLVDVQADLQRGLDIMLQGF